MILLPWILLAVLGAWCLFDHIGRPSVATTLRNKEADDKALAETLSILATNTGRMVALLASLAHQADENLATGLRIEDANAVVASDLKESHERADAANGPAGTQADAAAASSPST